WSGAAGATLGYGAVARGGNWALAVQGPDTLREFGVTDSPNWVATASPNPGGRYRFACWVRADSAVGKARILVREYLRKVRIATTYSSDVALGPGWRKIVVDHVTA